ncbi:hypothetical protein Q5752_001185 [Cryptotrichosporon argae]
MPSAHHDPRDFTVVRCTPAQTVQTHRNHHAHWGVALGVALEPYLGFCAALDNPPSGHGDRHATWALVRRGDEDTLDLLAHCETFRRAAAFALPHQAAAPTYTYGVAAVYCPPAHRGNGYPQILLRLLHYVLAAPAHLPPFPAAWGAPPAVPGFRDARFSVLYSALGDRYYAGCRQGEGAGSRAGWVAQPVVTRKWDIDSAGEGAAVDETWAWMDAEDLKSRSLGDEVADEMMAALAHAGDAAKTRVAILPRDELLCNQPMRSLVLSGGKPATATRKFGLSAPAPAPGAPRPFIAYTVTDAPDGRRHLLVDFVRHPFPFGGLVAAARHEGCMTFEVWGADGAWADEAAGAALGTPASIPSLTEYGLGGVENVKWLWSQKYSNC